MNRTIPTITAILLLGVSWSMTANATFTGDKKAACEALLCLMAGERPDECTPPIRRYFSITHRKPHKQLKARKSFLKLCPTGEDNIADVVAEGAGRCEPEALVKELNPHSFGFGKVRGMTKVKDEIPRECSAFLKLGGREHTLPVKTYVRMRVQSGRHGRYVDVLRWKLP